MISVLIIALIISIVSLSLLVSEKKKNEDFREEHEHMKAELSSTQEALSSAVRPLDVEAIESILDRKGCEHSRDEAGMIWFTKDNARFCIGPQNLPLVRIGKGYNMEDNESVDWEALSQAGNCAEEKIIMSEFRYGEKSYMEFYLNCYEHYADSFEKSFQSYLDILNATEQEFYTVYNEIRDRKRLEEQNPENRMERMANEMAIRGQWLAEGSHPGHKTMS